MPHVEILLLAHDRLSLVLSSLCPPVTTTSSVCCSCGDISPDRTASIDAITTLVTLLLGGRQNGNDCRYRWYDWTITRLPGSRCAERYRRAGDRPAMTEVAIPGSTSFVDPLGRRREARSQTATKSQPKALLLYPQGRVWAGKGYLLLTRAIADSPVKKKNRIQIRRSVISKSQHR